MLLPLWSCWLLSQTVKLLCCSTGRGSLIWMRSNSSNGLRHSQECQLWRPCCTCWTRSPAASPSFSSWQHLKESSCKSAAFPALRWGETVHLKEGCLYSLQLHQEMLQMSKHVLYSIQQQKTWDLFLNSSFLRSVYHKIAMENTKKAHLLLITSRPCGFTLQY